MQMDRILKTTVALVVLGLVFDYISMNFVLGGYLATLPFLDTSSSAFSLWGVVGYVAAAFVWTLVYDRVRSTFAPTAGGGMQFGFYAGLLMNFPTWLFVSNYWSRTGRITPAGSGCAGGWSTPSSRAPSPASCTTWVARKPRPEPEG